MVVCLCLSCVAHRPLHARESSRGWHWQMCEGLGVRWVMSSKFIPSLQAALSVCLRYVFGQQCLMGCHSLPRQYYYPTCFSTSFSSIFLVLSSCVFCHIRCQCLLDMKHFSSPVVYLQSWCVFFFFFLFCLTHLLLPSWPPLFSCNQSLL